MHKGLMKFTEEWTEENWGYQAALLWMVEMVDVNVGYILDTGAITR